MQVALAVTLLAGAGLLRDLHALDAFLRFV
jgi:hypothetical protein